MNLFESNYSIADKNAAVELSLYVIVGQDLLEIRELGLVDKHSLVLGESSHLSRQRMQAKSVVEASDRRRNSAELVLGRVRTLSSHERINPSELIVAQLLELERTHELVLESHVVDLCLQCGVD